MKICDRCKEGEGVHTYGRFKLCDDCRDFAEKEWRSEDKTPRVEIGEATSLGSRAEYINGEERIIFYEESANVFERVLNHEVMHHVLNYFVSTQASYCFDNIHTKVDDIHDS